MFRGKIYQGNAHFNEVHQRTFLLLLLIGADLALNTSVPLIKYFIVFKRWIFVINQKHNDHSTDLFFRVGVEMPFFTPKPARAFVEVSHHFVSGREVARRLRLQRRNPRSTRQLVTLRVCSALRRGVGSTSTTIGDVRPFLVNARN